MGVQERQASDLGPEKNIQPHLQFFVKITVKITYFSFARRPNVVNTGVMSSSMEHRDEEAEVVESTTDEPSRAGDGEAPEGADPLEEARRRFNTTATEDGTPVTDAVWLAVPEVWAACAPRHHREAQLAQDVIFSHPHTSIFFAAKTWSASGGAVEVRGNDIEHWFTPPPWFAHSGVHHHTYLKIVPRTRRGEYNNMNQGLRRKANAAYLKRIHDFVRARWPDADPVLWSKGRVIQGQIVHVIWSENADQEPMEGKTEDQDGAGSFPVPVTEGGVLVPLRRGHNQCMGAHGCPYHADYMDLRTPDHQLCYTCAETRGWELLHPIIYMPYQDEERVYYWPRRGGTRQDARLTQYHGFYVGDLPYTCANQFPHIEKKVQFGIRHVHAPRELTNRGKAKRGYCIGCFEERANWGTMPTGEYRISPLTLYCKACAEAMASITPGARAQHSYKIKTLTIKTAVLALFHEAGMERAQRTSCIVRAGTHCNRATRRAHHCVVDTEDDSVKPTGKLVCEDRMCIEAALQILPSPLGIQIGDRVVTRGSDPRGEDE